MRPEWRQKEKEKEKGKEKEGKEADWPEQEEDLEVVREARVAAEREGEGDRERERERKVGKFPTGLSAARRRRDHGGHVLVQGRREERAGGHICARWTIIGGGARTRVCKGSIEWQASTRRRPQD